MAAPAIATSSETASNVFTKPTGLADGDVLYILYWSYHGSAGTPAAPAGFTEIAGAQMLTSGGTPSYNEGRIYRKVVTSASGEPATYTVTRGPGTNFADGGEIYRISGADTTAPEDAFGTGTGTSTTASTGSITTTSATDLLLALVTNNGASQTTPSGMAQEFSQDGGDAEAFSETTSSTLSGATRTSTLGSSQAWVVPWVAVQPTGPWPHLVGAGTAAYTVVNGATISPGLPTGWAADDIHVLLAARSDNVAMTSLSGWTQLSAGDNTAAQRVEVWWRRAVAGDTAPTVTFGTGSVAVRGARIIGIRGCPTSGDPFSTTLTRSDNAASATVTFATITPPDANTLLLALYAYEDDPTAASQMSGWSTFAVDSSSGGADMALGYAVRPWLSASSATGALTSTVSGGTFTNSVNTGFFLALKPVVAGGASEAAAGASAGVSTVSGTLSATVPIAASTAGASVASASAQATVPIAASTAGASTASGTVRATVPVAASTAGASTVAGAITVAAGVAGSAAGVASVSGTLSATVPVAGTSAGTSTTTGAVQSTVTIVATTAGSSVVAGAIDIAAGIAGSVAGVSTVAGTVRATVAVAGASAGDATVGAALSATVPISGASGGVSAVGGTLASQGQELAVGSAAGVSTVSGALSSTVPIAASSAGVSGVSGAVTVAAGVAGASAGVSTVLGTLQATVPVSGASAGVSTASADLTVTPQAGQSEAVAGTSTAVSSLAAALSAFVVIAGSVTGASTATANLSGGSAAVPATRAAASDAAYTGATASDAAYVGAGAGDLALVGATGSDSEV